MSGFFLSFVLVIGFPAGLLALVGLGMIGVALYWNRLRRRSQQWPSTEAKILACRLITIQKRGGSCYRAQPRYEYAVAGRYYQGERAFFGDRAWCGSRAAAEADQQHRYVPGTWVTVYYDPRHPQRASLSREYHASLTWLLVLGAVFLLVGSAMNALILPNALERCGLTPTATHAQPGTPPWCDRQRIF